MSSKFENTLIEAFEDLNTQKFKVNLETHHLFVCGGEVDAKANDPMSFRDHLITYSASKFSDIHDSIVQAETFKDYFKENAYPDLLVFEEEIANLASLVIIFLESPGSLVELGMFCTKPDFFKKLIIIAPQEEVEGEDSFIYLGPLENIKKKEPTAVAIYPWPVKGKKYENSHLEDLCKSIEEKLSFLPKNVEFCEANSGHIALLIAEIIRISYPIILSEIEFVLMALELDIKQSEITRHIYLLNKLKIIDSIFYSRYRYYFSTQPQTRILNFGKLSTGNGFDEQSVRMKIQQSFVISDDDQSRKRQNAMKQILAKLKKGVE
ncbi:retron St85 family effector protein [Pseudoalteromonas spongiae]|uniref:retron St85 family effector protein n=1 Tax=Pseudoalteromonas spongiae TaxID=298657 RepID=UPI000C2D3F6E|nr:retron St85 family effector protein [Pseudoalteromonas spongiae]